MKDVSKADATCDINHEEREALKYPFISPHGYDHIEKDQCHCSLCPWCYYKYGLHTLSRRQEFTCPTCRVRGGIEGVWTERYPEETRLIQAIREARGTLELNDYISNLGWNENGEEEEEFTNDVRTGLQSILQNCTTKVVESTMVLLYGVFIVYLSEDKSLHGYDPSDANEIPKVISRNTYALGVINNLMFSADKTVNMYNYYVLDFLSKDTSSDDPIFTSPNLYRHACINDDSVILIWDPKQTTIKCYGYRSKTTLDIELSSSDLGTKM